MRLFARRDKNQPHNTRVLARKWQFYLTSFQGLVCISQCSSTCIRATCYQHILGLSQTHWIWIFEDRIHKAIVTISLPCDFYTPMFDNQWSKEWHTLHEYSLHKCIWGGKPEYIVWIYIWWVSIDFVWSSKTRSDYPRNSLPRTGNTWESTFKQKAIQKKQPAGKLSNSTLIFHVISAGSSSTSKKVMWQQEIQKEDSRIPRWNIQTLATEADVPWICF